jgi:hypothetical protein
LPRARTPTPSQAADQSRIRVSAREAAGILAPYFWSKAQEQLRAVLPVALFLAAFQVLALGRPVADGLAIGLGIGLVVLGLMFFMEGLRLGLMPFGEAIGAQLPLKAGLGVVLLFAFFTGVGATLAEPAIGVLRASGAWVEPSRSPLLYALLNQRSEALVAAVGLGVGAAATLGILRFFTGWSLKPIALGALALAAALSLWASAHPETRAILGLAWDSGAVTTGPVTVPLVLALGVGVSRAMGRADTGLAGFGIVTLASLFPVITVLAFGLAVFHGGELGPSAAVAEAAANGPGPALGAFLAAVQATVPLFLFLYLFLRFVLKAGLPRRDEVLLGMAFCLVGMAAFNLGLAQGLTPLAGQVGSQVPSAYHPPDASLYGGGWGVALVILFAAVLGYGTTRAEPALNALGMTVEEVTSGAFKRRALIHAVAVGVGLGIALGMAKLIFDLPLLNLLLPVFGLVAVLALLSSEEYVNIGWDSGGVTTGPLNVPLVMALGLGVGKASGLADAFGVLALAGAGAILAVLTVGLAVRQRA